MAAIGGQNTYWTGRISGRKRKACGNREMERLSRQEETKADGGNESALVPRPGDPERGWRG